MERFRTKNIVITSAGSGFGRGLALFFAKLGWNVAASDIDMNRAAETARLVNEAGGCGLAYRCDVTKPGEIRSLADSVMEKWGSLDIIVNNAGVPVFGFMEKVRVEDWKFEIEIMLMSVIYGQNSGHIGNDGTR